MNDLKYTFEFSFPEVIKLIKGLQELPYKESNDTIKYIQDSYYKQQQEFEVKAKTEKEKDTKKSITPKK